MRAPIRRGTAQRLGLRQPPYPTGLLEFPRPISDEDWQKFKARWQLEHGVVVLTEEERDLQRGVEPITDQEFTDNDRMDDQRPPWWRRILGFAEPRKGLDSMGVDPPKPGGRP
jgi:hypothetical protein